MCFIHRGWELVWRLPWKCESWLSEYGVCRGKRRFLCAFWRLMASKFIPGTRKWDQYILVWAILECHLSSPSSWAYPSELPWPPYPLCPASCCKGSWRSSLSDRTHSSSSQFRPLGLLNAWQQVLPHAVRAFPSTFHWTAALPSLYARIFPL